MSAELYKWALPILKLGFFMYAIGILSLWTLVRFLSSEPGKVSPFRASIGVVILLTISGNVARKYLAPEIGHFVVLAQLGLYTMIVKLGFALPVWKAFLVACVYILVLAGALMFYVHFFGPLPTALQTSH